MPSILRQIGEAVNISVNHYEADTEQDMYQIQVMRDGELIVPMGSTCYVINSGTQYKLNSQGAWKEVPTGGGGYDPSNHYIWDGGKADGTWN